MADETAEHGLGLKVRLFNRDTQARILEWGAGKVLPGGFIDVDDPTPYNPDTEGSPWTVDAEAAEALSALLSVGHVPLGTPSDLSPDGVSGPQDGSQVPSDDVPASADTTAPEAVTDNGSAQDGEPQSQVGGTA